MPKIMKVRLVKTGTKVFLLCSNGTIAKATPALISAFFNKFHHSELFVGTDGMWSDIVLDITEYPGETMAYVTDNNQLVVISPWVADIVSSNVAIQPHELTLAEFAAKNHCSKEMVKHLVREKRIPEAIKRGRQWFIPENTPYPIDAEHRRSGSGRAHSKAT